MDTIVTNMMMMMMMMVIISPRRGAYSKGPAEKMDEKESRGRNG